MILYIGGCREFMVALFVTTIEKCFYLPCIIVLIKQLKRIKNCIQVSERKDENK